MKKGEIDMKIYESYKDIPFAERHFYCQDLNVKVDVYYGGIQITDLTNAMKVGKECNVYTLVADRNKYQTYDQGLELKNDLLMVMDWKEICEEAFKKSENIEGVSMVAEWPKKGVWTFSPFVKMTTKGKPSGANFPKLVLSGKIASATCRYSFTDDYYDDAKRTFDRGKSINPMELAEEIVNDRYQNWHFDGQCLYTENKAYDILMVA